MATSNSAFFQRAYSTHGPKMIRGFSRPVYHNVMGLRYGRQFDKMGYGGMIRHTEAGMLSVWAGQVPSQGIIVEIGCYGGLSTSYLVKGSERSQAHIFAIDPFDSDLPTQAERTDGCVALEDKPSKAAVAQRIEKLKAADRVTLIEGYSQDVVQDWDQEIDFLWIDGNHDQAYRDFTNWSPFVKTGGRVAFHDAHPRYGYPQVADDARKALETEAWMSLEHVKSIISGIKKA